MFYLILAVFHLAAALVKRRVASIEILRIKIILRYAESVGNTVNMKYLFYIICFLYHFVCNKSQATLVAQIKVRVKMSAAFLDFATALRAGC